MEKAIVFMVAGISKRFNSKIKQFAQVGKNNETLIKVSLDHALKAGFNKIIFIVGNKTEKPFKEKFGNNYKGIKVEYAVQPYDEAERDKPWGTTDALCSAKELIDYPFVVCNGDDLYGENTFKVLSETLYGEGEATIGYDLGGVLPEKGSTCRGIFNSEEGYVKEIKEYFDIEKDKLAEKGLTETDLCSMNIFALHPEVIGMLHEKLVVFKEKNKGDRKIESLLPQDLSELINEEKIKMKLFPATEKWIGVTNPGDEVFVREFLKND